MNGPMNFYINFWKRFGPPLQSIALLVTSSSGMRCLAQHSRERDWRSVPFTFTCTPRKAPHQIPKFGITQGLLEIRPNDQTIASRQSS